MSGTAAVVLAAGLGTRMKSATPKVLHPLCGRPMLAYVLDAWASTEDGAAGVDNRATLPCLAVKLCYLAALERPA